MTESELRKVIVQYQTYVNAGDAHGYVSLLSDDVVWMPPNGPDRIGKPDVLKAQSVAFSKFKFNVEVTPTEVRKLNDKWGLVVCSIRGTLTPLGEKETIRILFRTIFLMVRQPDGIWRIARQIWNNKLQEGWTKTGGPW